jgi:acyl dehydratase
MRLALTAPFGGPPSDGMYTTSGYVRVFEYNANDGKDQASVWKPVGRTVSFQDEFGTAADLSADGKPW